MNILDKNQWLGLNGEPIEDIRAHINKYLNSDYTMHVGTDTKPRLRDTTVITAICFREQNKGAVVAYQKFHTDPFPSVRDRLFYETYISLEVAAELLKLTKSRPTIHADVNPKKEALSNTTLDAIIGLVKGMGYEVLVKPDAWASDIADMYTR